MTIDGLISVEELRTYINDEVSPTLIDVRAPEAYARGHLPGAVNIPKDQVSGSMDVIPLDRPVVTYCNMHQPGSSSSEMAAEVLRDAGIHARALQGGYPEWKDAGYPIDMHEHSFPQNWQEQRRA